MTVGADYRSLVATIDKVYAAALDSARWDGFLSSAASMFDADNASICEIQQRRRIVGYISMDDFNRDLVPVARYQDLVHEDPRQAIFNSVQGRAVHCRMGLSDETLRGSRAYRDYLKPLNIEYAMVAFVAGDVTVA